MKPKLLSHEVKFRIGADELRYLRAAAAHERREFSAWCRDALANRARTLLAGRLVTTAPTPQADVGRPVGSPSVITSLEQLKTPRGMTEAQAVKWRAAWAGKLAREEAARAAALVPPSLPPVVWDEPAPDGAPLAGPGSDEERQAEAHARAARLAADLAMIPVDDDAEGERDVAAAGRTGTAAPTAGEGDGTAPFEEPAQGQVREAGDF